MIAIAIGFVFELESGSESARRMQRRKASMARVCHNKTHQPRVGPRLRRSCSSSVSNATTTRRRPPAPLPPPPSLRIVGTKDKGTVVNDYAENPVRTPQDAIQLLLRVEKLCGERDAPQQALAHLPLFIQSAARSGSGSEQSKAIRAYPDGVRGDRDLGARTCHSGLYLPLIFHFPFLILNCKQLAGLDADQLDATFNRARRRPIYEQLVRVVFNKLIEGLKERQPHAE